jgi:CRISPR system Cascade subunit CasA
MQAHAPQGSAGYFTSLRGGGPSTTLILCDTLWKTVWANVGEQASFGMKGREDLCKILPWAGGDPKHPLAVLWGQPRRMLLDDPVDGSCSSCRAAGPVVKRFTSYRGGIKYLETEWRHPLSPYESKEGGWLVRPTEGDLVGYRHWMGLLVDTPNGDGIPAFTVKRWIERDVAGESVRLWGYGYACNQAAVNRWCEGKMPVVSVPPAVRPPLERFIRTLVTMAERGREQLQAAIYSALKFSRKPTHPSRLSISLWARTEAAFLSHFRQGAASTEKEALERLLDSWLKVVQSESMTIYNEAIRAASPDWAARYGHKLRRKLGDADPVSLKTKKYGDWRLHESA